MRSSKDAKVDTQVNNVQTFRETATPFHPSVILVTLLLLTPQLVAANDSTASTLRYPLRPNRYYSFGWNRKHQDCYLEDDIQLLYNIRQEHAALTASDVLNSIFALQEDKKYYEQWTCTRPTLTNLLNQFNHYSYTLPNREAKDTLTHPLWNFSDRMARQIANWQGERTKNQNADLMNDPVMLVFEELKEWFFNSLASKECRKEEWENIAQRQSYIKNIIHLIPNFGPDRLHLHEIQQSLEQAAKIIFSCTANKELPKLLSELIISGKSLENTLGTYLHFLLINEEVADNFSPIHLEGGTRNCDLSPLCKIYAAVKKHYSESPSGDCSAVDYFYQKTPISDQHPHKMRIVLKRSLLNEITFASFVKLQDKSNYIEAVAVLDTLIQVRKIFEEFQDILPRIGTYIYAVNYLERVDMLACNYLNLIAKAKALMQKLIHTADMGLNSVLYQQQAQATTNLYFEKNIRALETRVAKGTTVNALLENYCQHTIERMQYYQQEMKKLVRNIHSGEASQEIGHAMGALFIQINRLNHLLPGILGKEISLLEESPKLPALQSPYVEDSLVDNSFDMLSSAGQINSLLNAGISTHDVMHPTLTSVRTANMCSQPSKANLLMSLSAGSSLLLFGILATCRKMRISKSHHKKMTTNNTSLVTLSR